MSDDLIQEALLPCFRPRKNYVRSYPVRVYKS